jgi:transcriptional regulator with XRE-family HTH domain
LAVIDQAQLEYVFGRESRGLTEIERAQSSDQEFVRSQDHLAFADQQAEGRRRLSAIEALAAYGFDKLLEAREFGVAVIAASDREPAKTLRARREALGLSEESVAKASRVPIEIVRSAEDPTNRTPIRMLERIAITLGLDERIIGVADGAGGSNDLAVRLRTLGQAKTWFSSVFVASLSEAAWVIATQLRLQKRLRNIAAIPITPDANYGNKMYPAWRHGYYLATKARKDLFLGDAAIGSLRSLCWRLGIPLVHATLPDHFAGATLRTSEGRGILVNTAGANASVWVRRSTIAHELGHLLWDPEDRLKTVTVDNFDDIDSSRAWNDDFTEARANAFAVELLGPWAAVHDVFNAATSDADGIGNVMNEFGMSFTAARHHVTNGLKRPIRADSVITEPSADWRGREGFTEDYFPIVTTSQLRRGEFAGLVVEAERQRLISNDTASTYLETDLATYHEQAPAIADIFPVADYPSR